MSPAIQVRCARCAHPSFCEAFAYLRFNSITSASCCEFLSVFWCWSGRWRQVCFTQIWKSCSNPSVAGPSIPHPARWLQRITLATVLRACTYWAGCLVCQPLCIFSLYNFLKCTPVIRDTSLQHAQAQTLVFKLPRSLGPPHARHYIGMRPLRTRIDAYGR